MGQNGNGLSAADVALLNDRNNMDFSGNSFMWIFALLILAGGGFNGFGGGYRPQYATQDFVQNGFNFNDLQDQNRDIMNAITNGAAQAVAATNQAKYDNINVIKDSQMALANQISDVRAMEQNLLGNQNECCCSTKMLISEGNAALSAQIAQNKYENAMALAGLEQRLTAKMDQNEITSLRDQIQQLQLARATNNVVRYPNAWTYNAGPSPFCGCGCNAM